MSFARARVTEARGHADYDALWLARITADLLGARVGDLRQRFGAARTVLLVDRSAMWFELAGTRVSCLRRPVTRRLVEALAAERVRAPGKPCPASVLVEAAWASERMHPTSAKNRLHVALTELRKLGFRALLVATDEGYFLDPAGVDAKFTEDDPQT